MDKMVNIKPTSPMKKKRTPKIKEFPHPVDSGWSWITLIGAFVIYLTVGGVLRTFGIFMVEFLADYDTDSATSSLIIGLQFATSGVVGFLGMTVGLKFVTPRQLIMTGGFIGSLGLIINTFAKSIYFFILSHSIMVGAAIGALNGPCLYELGRYFDKKKSLANGVAMGGISFGGFVMGPFSRILIDTYALKGAFLILGALHFHIVAAGALLRPSSFYRIVRKRKRKINDATSPNYSSSASTKHYKKSTRTHGTNSSGHERQRHLSLPDYSCEVKPIIGRKISDSNKCDIALPEQTKKLSNTSLSETQKADRSRKKSDTNKPESTNLQRSRKISDPTPPRSRKISDNRKPETVSLLEESNEQLDGFRPRSLTSDSFSPLARKAMFQRMRSRTESEVVQVDISPDTLAKSSSHGNIASAYSDKRKREFYVNNEFVFDISTAEIIRSISYDSIGNKSHGETSNSTVANKETSVITILKYIFNYNIFKDPAFTVYLIGYIIGSIGSFYPIVFIPPLGDSYEIDKTKVSLIISITSVIDVFGRTGTGIMADRAILGLGRKQIMLIALITCGTMNFLNTFYDQFWSLTLFAVVYGIVGGSMFALNTSTLSETVEQECFGQAVGFLVGAQQLSLGAGGPIAGAFRDWTGTYTTTFYFLGCCNFIGALFILLLILYPKIRQFLRKPKQDISEDSLS